MSLIDNKQCNELHNSLKGVWSLSWSKSWFTRVGNQCPPC
jgi:hypothetical protein